MAQQAQVEELKRGDSRLGEELTGALSGGSAWAAMFAAATDNPTVAWSEMNRERPAAAIEHYAAMEEKDGHYGAQLETRKDAVLGKAMRVQPASESARDMRVAEFVEETLDGIADFENALRGMLDALGKGVSIGEILYELDGRELRIRDVAFRPQKHFAFGEPGEAQTGDLRVANEQPLPANKFVVCTFQPYLCNRWGRPLARRCYWPSWFKRQDIRFWLKMAEKGSGTVIAKYRAGAEAAEQQQALDAAIKVNDETAVAVNADFVVEVLQQTRPANPEMYKALAEDFANNEISKVVLGQVLTSAGSDQGSGSLALGEVHNDVRQEKVEADARMLARCVTQQLIRPLVTLNFGDVAAPRWIIEAEQGEDLKQLAETYRAMVDFGLPIPVAHARERFQIPEAEEGELTLQGQGTRGQGQEDGSEFIDPEGAPEPVLVSDAGVDKSKPLYGAMANALIARALEAIPEEADA